MVSQCFRASILASFLALPFSFVLGQSLPDKTGTKPSVLSLPSGPGSIEGLGKAFQAHLNTGTAAYSLELKLPPGPAGFAPTVALSYNSGGGNSAFGHGWSYSPLSIERQTEKGFPRYLSVDSDGAARDTFVFGSEELVPLSNGTYRCENETEFRRFRPVEGAQGEELSAWLIEDSDGTKHWLGRHLQHAQLGSSRIPHPTPSVLPEWKRTGFDLTYSWLEDAAEDVSGNRIEYTYTTFENSPNQLFIQEIRFFPRDQVDAHHSVFFYYEDRTDCLEDHRTSFPRVNGQRCREIAVSSFYGTIRHRVRSYVLSYDVSDEAFGNSDSGAPPVQQQLRTGLSRLRSITEYGSDRIPNDPNSVGTPLPATRFSYTASYLTEMSPSAFRNLSPLAYRLQRIPDIQFAERDPRTSGAEIGALTQSEQPHRLDGTNLFDVFLNNPHVQFVDMNADGLVDLLDSFADPNSTKPKYTIAYNHGHGVFSQSVAAFVTENPVGINLSQSTDANSVILADANGDGVSDIVHMSGVGSGRVTRIHPNLHLVSRSGQFSGFAAQPIQELTTPSTLSQANFDSRSIDLNFDKRPDLLTTSETGITGHIANDSQWTNSGQIPWQLTSGDGGVPQDYRFSMFVEAQRKQNPLVSLVDMNGDRLLDLVRVIVNNNNEVEVRYLPQIGLMRFGTERTLCFARVDGSPTSVPGVFSTPGIRFDAQDPQNGWEAIRFLDANGDGLADLVYFGQSQQLTIYFNCSGLALQGPHRVADTPVYDPYSDSNPTIVRILDLNGNGSEDLVYYHARGAHDRIGFRYVDFMGGQKPGMLQVIDNGIGQRTFIRYRPITEDLIRANLTGHAWTTSLPIPTWVVSAVIDDPGLDLDLDGATDLYATLYDYRDGFYDGFEKQFRGFSYVQEILYGDDIDSSGLPTTNRMGVNAQATLVRRHRFHTGSSDGIDNDVYIDGFDTEPRPSPIDETFRIGGREEEPLKGKLLWTESTVGHVLVDPDARFDKCARQAAIAALQGGLYAPAATNCTPNKYVYSRTSNRWDLRRLYRSQGVVAPKGRLRRIEDGIVTLVDASVTFAAISSVETETIEANELLRAEFSHANAPVFAVAPILTKREIDYDDFGNTTFESDLGIVGAGFDDERVIKRSFITPPDSSASSTWILNRIRAERTTDENGVFCKEKQFFYDGQEFQGLPLGQIDGRGLVKRVRQRVRDPGSPIAALDATPTASGIFGNLAVPGDPRAAADEWIDVERIAHDAYGNVTWTMDPLGVLLPAGTPDTNVGHVLQVSFDNTFHTYPEKETAFVGGGRTPLTMTASYEADASSWHANVSLGHGVMTKSIDYNSNATEYLYDRFARLTAIQKPSDSDQFPTLTYQYIPADPHRSIAYSYDRLGTLQNLQINRINAANAVWTKGREESGLPGTFDSVTYTDGMGLQIAALEEDDVEGQFVVKSYLGYNQRKQKSVELVSYTQSGSLLRPPLAEQHRENFFRDPLSRVIRHLQPSETHSSQQRFETRTHHLPFQTHSFDEEDLASADASSTHTNTPWITKRDGLSRTISIETIVKNKGDGTADRTLQVWTNRFGYNLNDQLVHTIDAQQNQRWFRFDGLGRRIYASDLDRGVRQYWFDGASKLQRLLDAKGQETKYTYDGRNRLKSVDYQGEAYPQSPDEEYFYDEPQGPVSNGAGGTDTAKNTRGRLAYVKDGSGQEHLSYDSLGRQHWTIKQFSLAPGGPTRSFKTVETFDPLDRMSSVTYPDGELVKYRFGSRGKVVSIECASVATPIANRIGYTPFGQQSSFDFGNGVSTTFRYDPRKRLASLKSVQATSGSLCHFEYQYDLASNLLAIQDIRPVQIIADGSERRNTQYFVYDDIFRLTKAEYSFAPPNSPRQDSGNMEFAFDRIGNLVSKVSSFQHSMHGLNIANVGQLQFGGVQGASNRVGRGGNRPGPHAATAVNNVLHRFDANGNTEYVDGNAIAWDFEDRMISISNDRFDTTYLYDYAGRRIRKSVQDNASGETQRTAYVNKYVEIENDGTYSKYLWYEETRVASFRNKLSDTLTYYHADHLGSTSLRSNSSGVLVDEHAYFPFGHVRNRFESQASNKSRYLFSQKEYDPESTFSNFGARMYNPRIGQFASVDTAFSELWQDQDSLAKLHEHNLYSYGAQNPLVHTDPSGEFVVPATITALVLAYKVYSAYDTAKSGVEFGQAVVKGDTRQVLETAAVFGSVVIAGKVGKSVAGAGVTILKKGADSKLLTKGDIAKYLSTAKSKSHSEIAKDLQAVGLKVKGQSPDGKFMEFADKAGDVRAKLHPPDSVTKHSHLHIYNKQGHSLDAGLNKVPSKSPDAHIPTGGQ